MIGYRIISKCTGLYYVSLIYTVFIACSVSSCLGCGSGPSSYSFRTGDDLPRLPKEVVVALLPQSFSLTNLKGGVYKDNSIMIPILLKNEGAAIDQEQLEKIKFKIFHQDNVGTIKYVTKAKKNEKGDLDATEFSVINDSISLWELLKVFNLTVLDESAEKKTFLLLFPQNLNNPSNFAAELEGSESTHTYLPVKWESMFDLGVKLKKDNLKSDMWGITEPLDTNGELVLNFVIENRDTMNLSISDLQLCNVKFDRLDNVEKFFYAGGENPNGSYQAYAVPSNVPTILNNLVLGDYI